MPVTISTPANGALPTTVAYRLLVPQDLGALNTIPDGSIVFLQTDAQGGLRISNIAELVELRKIFLALVDFLTSDPTAYETIRVRAIASVADDLAAGVPSIPNTTGVPPGNPSASPM